MTSKIRHNFSKSTIAGFYKHSGVTKSEIFDFSTGRAAAVCTEDSRPTTTDVKRLIETNESKLFTIVVIGYN